MTTVYVDYRGRDHVAGMVIGGMTIVERVLREAAKRGATRAVVRTNALPRLPALPLAVEQGDPAPLDGNASSGDAIDGDVVAGVKVSDEPSRRAASRALLQSLRRPHDGIGDRYFIRAISVRLTGLLALLRATPNQVTAVNIVVGCVACYFAAAHRFALAGVLMVVQAIFDSCDGELARLRYLHSKFGMWLDNTSDDVIDNLFVAMLALGVGGRWAVIGVIAAIARSLSALMIHLDVAKRGRPGDVLSFTWWFDTADEDLAERFDTGTSVLGVVRALGRRDLYVLVWGATCVVGLPQLGLAVSIAISGAYFLLAILHLAFAPRTT